MSDSEFGSSTEQMVQEKADVEQDKSQEPPNGGARAWMVALGAFAAQMCTFGYVNTFGVYQEYLASHQLSHHTAANISWIGSLQAFFLFFCGAFSGPLSDRLGVKAVIIPSGLALVFSVMMTSLCKKYYEFILAQGILGGAACGMIFTPVVSTVGQYFTTKRAYAMGIVVSGAAIGGIILPIVLIRLFQETGYGWAVRVDGFIMLVLLTYAAITTKEFAPRRPKGLFLVSALKEWPYMLINAAFFLALFGAYTPIFFIVDYSLYRGMDPTLAMYQVAILNAPSFFGRVVPNFAGDKFGRLNMAILSYFACAILCFCWTAAKSTAGITVFIALYGFFSGGIFSLYSPCVAQVCPNPSNIGTYVGQGLAMCSFGSLAGSPANATLVAEYGYLASSMFSAAFLTVGGICLVATKLYMNKNPFAVI